MSDTSQGGGSVRHFSGVSCQIALKEWASVILAAGRGQQQVLIRKGGLIEPGSGFEFVAKEFLLYPTHEHQTVNYVRQEFTPLFEEAMAKKAPEGQLAFEFCATVVWSAQSRDPELIDRLEPFHMYNSAFQTQRLKWQPEQPLVVGVLRTYTLPSIVRVPMNSRYAGCKSWVELDQPVSLEGATPVLDDQAFAERLSRIHALLDSHDTISYDLL